MLSPKLAGFRPVRSALLLVVGIVISLQGAPALAQKEKPQPPASRRTQVLGQSVFAELEKAQKATDEDDYDKALSILDGLKRDFAKLNDYEKAMLWNFYAGVYYGKEDIPRTIDAYGNVLKQENLPAGLRNASLFAIAQLYLVTEKYQKALDVLAQWFASVDEAQPDAYILKAQALYQLDRFAAAESPIIEALKIAKERGQQARESWLSLLLAVYFEQDKYSNAAKVLELLVAYYPKATYYKQLSGIYGLLDREVDQIAVQRAAYEAGMLDNESDIMNLARMYLSKEAPFPAIQVMRTALASKAVKEDADSLKLYAQALAFGQEHEAQIPVLEKLAKLTKDGEHAVYLGQALTELGRWTEAADAYRTATKDKDLKRPGSAWLNVGTSLYNADDLEEARDAFRKATKFEDSAEQAQQWIRFISSEIERKAVLAEY